MDDGGVQWHQTKGQEMEASIDKLYALKKLREPFPENQISLLPKPYKKDSQKGNCKECGGYHGLPALHLKFVGHAALTNRLLEVDPLWSWAPLSYGPDGLPLFDKQGGLWITLTIVGVTRLGYGAADGKVGPDATKEIIGDALRNAAMRFGAALDLWHKGDLYGEEEETESVPINTKTTAPAPSVLVDAEKHLERLRAASFDGYEALKKAVGNLPEGAAYDTLWSVNKVSLLKAAKDVDKAKNDKTKPPTAEAVANIIDDIPFADMIDDIPF